MLDKGIIERIVLDYKDIYKQALEDNIQSPAELPYFEGDFWPNVMEENIRELEQEEEARKRVRTIFSLAPIMILSDEIFFYFLRDTNFCCYWNYRRLKRRSAWRPHKRLKMMSLAK